MGLQTETMRGGNDVGGDIDHCGVMKVMLMVLVMKKIWMRMTAEVLLITMMLGLS